MFSMLGVGSLLFIIDMGSVFLIPTLLYIASTTLQHTLVISCWDSPTCLFIDISANVDRATSLSFISLIPSPERALLNLNFNKRSSPQLMIGEKLRARRSIMRKGSWSIGVQIVAPPHGSSCFHLCFSMDIFVRFLSDSADIIVIIKRSNFVCELGTGCVSGRL